MDSAFIKTLQIEDRTQLDLNLHFCKWTLSFETYNLSWIRVCERQWPFKSESTIFYAHLLLSEYSTVSLFYFYNQKQPPPQKKRGKKPRREKKHKNKKPKLPVVHKSEEVWRPGSNPGFVVNHLYHLGQVS